MTDTARPQGAPMTDDTPGMFEDGWVTYCPECGQPITGLSHNVEHREEYPLVPMWEGGPLVSATWELPTLVPVSDLTTFSPCGHTRAGTDWTIVTVRFERPVQ